MTIIVLLYYGIKQLIKMLAAQKSNIKPCTAGGEVLA
jgi:hypothetical protein